MIFLNDNVLLEKDVTHDNIKPRLLGHWGTCPGLIMVYAHLNRIIRKTGLDALYVIGPGTSTFIVQHSRFSADF
jgi:xylulose-5-phosphate/fructose-6-phosphate phosphoketolase